jgi:hypothetical protein
MCDRFERLTEYLRNVMEEIEDEVSEIEGDEDEGFAEESFDAPEDCDCELCTCAEDEMAREIFRLAKENEMLSEQVAELEADLAKVEFVVHQKTEELEEAFGELERSLEKWEIELESARAVNEAQSATIAAQRDTIDVLREIRIMDLGE